MASKCKENDIHWDICHIQNIMTPYLVRRQKKKKKNLNLVILYNIWKVFHCWLFFVERPWSENHPKKKYLWFCLALRYEKIWSKEPLQCTYDFITIHRSSLRALETKPVSIYMIHNLSYETTVAGVTKFLKALVKKTFSMGFSWNMRRKIISLVTKLA